MKARKSLAILSSAHTCCFWHRSTCLRVQVRKLSRLISLEELKGLRGGNATIAGMQLFTTARLSIQNVTQEQWEAVLALEDETAPL